MIAYTGIETVSNLSEEASDPPRDIPRSIRLVAVAVFAIYFTLPFIALSALPVHKVNGEYQTLLGLPPEEGGYANDPVLGLVKNLNLHGALERGLEVYVGVLAATILLVATNAGVIGASRITYAMATYRQLPEVFRRLHPRFQTPWLALLVFAGIASIAVILPGPDQLPRDDVRVRGDALVHDRPRGDRRAPRERTRRGDRVPRRGRTCGSEASTGLCSPSSAASGRARLARDRHPGADHALGRARLARDRIRHVRALPASASSICRCVRRCARRRSSSAALAVEYRTILVPVLRTAESEEALVAAARLASERRSRIVILARPRGAARPAARRRDGRAGSGRRRDPRRGAGAARGLYGVQIVSRLDPCAQRRAGDRRGGGAPRRRGDHPRRVAERACAAASRSSAERSTTCCGTRRRGSRSWPANGPPRRPCSDASCRWLVIALGIALVVRTIAAGVGGGLGILVGALLIARRGARGCTFRA